MNDHGRRAIPFADKGQRPFDMFMRRRGESVRGLVNVVHLDAQVIGFQHRGRAHHLGDIGHVIQQHAEKSGYSVVREFCGHGIGKVFHEEPQVLHYGRPGTLERLEPGMIFTIEPMINVGRREIRMLPDGWTVKTKDKKWSAQWEHTVLVTETGYEVLTLSAGSPPPPDFIKAKSQLVAA